MDSYILCNKPSKFDQNCLHRVLPFPVCEAGELLGVDLAVLGINAGKVDLGSEVQNRRLVRIAGATLDLDLIDSVLVHALEQRQHTCACVEGRPDLRAAVQESCRSSQSLSCRPCSRDRPSRPLKDKSAFNIDLGSILSTQVTQCLYLLQGPFRPSHTLLAGGNSAAPLRSQPWRLA